MACLGSIWDLYQTTLPQIHSWNLFHPIQIIFVGGENSPPVHISGVCITSYTFWWEKMCVEGIPTTWEGNYRNMDGRKPQKWSSTTVRKGITSRNVYGRSPKCSIWNGSNYVYEREHTLHSCTGELRPTPSIIGVLSLKFIVKFATEFLHVLKRVQTVWTHYREH